MDQPNRPRSSLKPAVRAVTLAGSSILAMALVAAAPRSPYQPPLMPGGGPRGPLRAVAAGLGLDRLEGNMQLLVATLASVAAVLAFLYLLRECLVGRVSTTAVVWLAVGAHLLLLFVPLLFSRDVYSYAFYGRIAGVYGGNPYVETPLDHSSDPLWDYVGPKWVDTPAVYGPAWITLSSALSRVLPQPVDHVEVYRYLAIAASLFTCVLLLRVVERLEPRRSAFALAAFGANPVVLFHSVASGHNDLLVVLAVVGALALLLRGHGMAAVAVLTLGALVKATAFIPLVLLLVWLVGRKPAGRRLRAGLAGSGIAVGMVLAFSLPYMQSRDPSLGMFKLAGHEGWLSTSMAVRRSLDWLTFDTLGWAVRVGFALVLLAGLIAVAASVFRRARDEAAREQVREQAAAWGWGLMLLMLLGPVLLPWYVVWSLPLVWAMPRTARTAVLTASSLLAVTLWSAEPLRYPGAFQLNLFVGRWIVTPVLLVMTVRALRNLWSRHVAGADLGGSDAALRLAVSEKSEREQRIPAAAG